MRNSPRPASSWIGHRCTPIEPLVIKSPDGSNIRCQALPIGRKASSVPRARSQSTTPSVRADGEHPAVMPDRRASDNLIGSREHEQRSGIPGPDRPGMWSVGPRVETTIRPSRLNSGPQSLGHAQQGPAQDRVPEPSWPSQPLLASSVPAGWKATLDSAVGNAFEGRPPVPVAVSQRSIL